MRLLTCQDFSVIENLPGGTSLHLSSASDDDNIQSARYTDIIGEESTAAIMSGHINTLLIEGSFEELCDELAVYLDGLLTAQNQTANVQSEIQPLLQAEKKDNVISALVKSSAVLNTAPERGVSPMLVACP